MNEPIAPTLADEVRRVFGGEAQRVLAALESYGQDSWHGEIGRVRAVIIDLANGNIQKVLDFVEVAKTDYRDVLYWHDIETKKQRNAR